MAICKVSLAQRFLLINCWSDENETKMKNDQLGELSSKMRWNIFIPARKVSVFTDYARCHRGASRWRTFCVLYLRIKSYIFVSVVSVDASYGNTRNIEFSKLDYKKYSTADSNVSDQAAHFKPLKGHFWSDGR